MEITIIHIDYIPSGVELTTDKSVTSEELCVAGGRRQPLRVRQSQSIAH